MSHKRRGQLTTSPEWAQHLRPLVKRFFWKGERRAERDVLHASARFVGELDPGVPPETAALVGTYATPSMAVIIADALRSDGIPVSMVVSGREGRFPRLNLVSSGVGLFVANTDEARARALARSIEEPVAHG